MSFQDQRYTNCMAINNGSDGLRVADSSVIKITHWICRYCNGIVEHSSTCPNCGAPCIKGEDT